MKNSTKRLLPLVLLLPLASCEGKINFFDQSFGLIYEKEGHYWLNNGQKVGFQGHAFDKLVLAYEETHTFTTDYVRHYYDYACRCGYKMSYDRLQFRGEDSIDSFFQSNSTEHHRNHKKPRFYQAGVKFIAKQDLPNLVRIEDGAFEESLFNEIEIGGRLEYLGKMAFCGSSIQKVSLAQTKIDKISDSCFYGCSYLKEVALPTTLQAIEANAFTDCKRLERIEIPEGTTYIGDASFAGYYFNDTLNPIDIWMHYVLLYMYSILGGIFINLMFDLGKPLRTNRYLELTALVLLGGAFALAYFYLDFLGISLVYYIHSCILLGLIALINAFDFCSINAHRCPECHGRCEETLISSKTTTWDGVGFEDRMRKAGTKKRPTRYPPIEETS